MKLYRIPEPGAIENLTLVEEPDPALGEHEVLIRVRAVSLNYRDLMVIRGTYGRGGQRPNLIPCSDGAGEVIAIGNQVSRVKVGNRVAGIFMQKWIAGEVTAEGAPQAGASALGGAIDGMLAEQVVLHEDGVVHIPEHLSFEEGSTLPCAAVTAWHAVVDFGRTRAGDTVLVLGTGGVSIFALQFARMHGARVIATSSNEEKIRSVHAMGADATVNYKSFPDWQHGVLEATAKRGVDLVVEVGGAGTLPRSIDSVRFGGKIALIGVLTSGEINPARLMGKSATLQGIYVGSREMFEAMNRAIALHKMRPVIDRVFEFDQAQEAYRHLASASHFGKVVIRVE